MSAAPSFQFFPQDFLVGTADMTPEEVGTYIRLLCYQWSKGFIPNDQDRCASMAGSGGIAVASVWHKFVLCEDGKMRNARMESVRTAAVKYREKQAINGAKRWKSDKVAGLAMPPLSQASDLAQAKDQPNGCSSSSSSEEEYKGESKTPTLKQVLEFAASPHGNTEAGIAEIWWNQNEGRPLTAQGNWTDSRGQPIRDWKKALRAYGLTTRRNDANRPGKPKVSTGLVLRECDIPGKFEGKTATELLREAMEEQP